jgi:thioredoxin 2
MSARDPSSTSRDLESTIVVCPSCGAQNRVPRAKVELGLVPVCGRCKTRLTIAHGVMAVSDDTFASEVERSTSPVVVDMWAPWCGPCRTIAPMIDELASEMAGRVRFAKLNVDENPRTAARFSITGIPALLVFKDGREVDRIVGMRPKSEIAERVRQSTS